MWYLAKVRLRNFLHLDKNHRRNFLRAERLGLTLVLDTNLWLAAVVYHLERPQLHVGLDRRVIKLATNQTLHIEHRVVRVRRRLKTATINTIKIITIIEISAETVLFHPNSYLPKLLSAEWKILYCYATVLPKSPMYSIAVCAFQTVLFFSYACHEPSAFWLQTVNHLYKLSARPSHFICLIIITVIKIIIIITDLYSAFRSEDTETLDAAQED